MKKRILTLLLALFTAGVGPVLTACSSDNDTPSDTTAADTTAADDPADTAAAAETEYITHLSAGFEPADYDGYEFTFITKSRTDAQAWWYIDREELDGEVLNDAIFERNRTIEEAYGVTIGALYSSNVVTDVPKYITAGDDAFDVMFCAIDNSSTFITGGYTVDFNEIENIDLDREWWDQEIIRDWTLNGKLYLLTGDISPSVNMRIYAMSFNKDMCNDLGIEYPYQTVLDGKWTLDYFSKFVRGINTDLNGDGNMDWNDRWGFLAVSGESTKELIAAGGRQTEVRNGALEFVLGEEANTTRFIKTLDTVADNTVTILADPYAAEHGWTAVTDWFAAGGALLKASCFEDIPRDLRSMDVDFGILPYPKYDESQDEYIALVANSGYLLSVPKTAKDLARTGMILEAMAAESVNTVTPALYEVSLEGKTARDTESEAMLDILFSNKFYDIAYCINLGGIWAAVDELESGNSTSVASMVAANTDKMNAAIDALMAAHKK